ncbi:glycosyltransferase family 2 protein [Patescibacteria group bacterium]|nr:glycosyltransferase family 2 protein [Patescibacteria group bacterium]
MKKIWAHTLVKNEERYLWYAIMSVINYVNKILIWDTGSTDKTVEIIKKLQNKYPHKIIFKEIGEVNIDEFTSVRQQMLDETKSDWVLILDGDEVWWSDSIRKVVDTIHKQGDKLETIVNPYYNIVGDIYHYQEKRAGRYGIDGKVGHYTIRAMNRKISGLHLDKPHGTQGFFDGKGRLIQKRPQKFRKFINAHFMHFTHMIRSSTLEKDLDVPKRKIKQKIEIGKSFPLDFHYPEVFFKPRPNVILSTWGNMDRDYYVKALIQTPLRMLKRRVWQGKVGY